MEKEYRKIVTVKAKIFEDGDEDGFASRYYDDSDVKKDGCITTSGIIGEHKIKVPYVSTLENEQHLSKGFGREYICTGIKGEKRLVDKDIFEKTYELVKPLKQAMGEKDFTWTNADIDAAYLMGAINCDMVKADEGEDWPILSKVLKELKRLEGLGFDRPYKAVREIRYGNKSEPPKQE